MPAPHQGSPYRPDASGAARRPISSGASQAPGCAECGEQLSLGTGDATETVCPSCGTRNELPPEHLALREACAREDAGDAAARGALYARLGGPPGWVARNAAPLSGAGLLLVGGSMLGWLLVAANGVPLARLLGVHPIDALGGGVRSALWAGVEVGVALLFTVLLFKLSDATKALGEKRALVMADAPREAGGARRCRACAAPLDVPRGALGARCAYCRADNLVSLPAPKRPPTGDFPLGARPLPRLPEVAAEIDAARPVVLPALLRAAMVAFVLGGLPVSCTYVMSRQRGGSWWSEVRGARWAHRVSGEPEVLAPGQTSAVPYCRPSFVRRRGRTSRDDDCGVQIALRRGETLVVTLSRVSPRVSVACHELGEEQAGEMPVTWSEGARHDDGTVDGAATFVAPYGGWFSLTVVDARAGMPTALFDEAQMRWSIAR